MTGPGRLIGHNPMFTEAGVATILLETYGEPGVVEVIAEGEGVASSKIEIQIGRNF